MTHAPDVLFDEMEGQGGNLGIITLNRPQVLNSLNHNMVNVMHAQLNKWASANHIKAVVIRSVEGRAFCAGGDLRSMYNRFKEHDPTLPLFFRHEYQLNRAIFHFPKPYIALLDGITMGGGVGISIHGSHRVATDRLLFAMPETGIGFFPDVGGTYFLPRMSHQFGFYLGLVGTRVGSDDCVALGIAQQKVNREQLSDLVKAIAETPFTHDAKASVTNIMEPFKAPIQPTPLVASQTVSAIEQCFSAGTIQEIVEMLQQSTNEFCKEAINTLKTKSPTSLVVTLQALFKGRQLDFDACMQQEFRLVCRFLQGHDFLEGVRALIIDKDQNPKWQPSMLKEVKEADIENYFAPLEKELV